LNTGLGEDDCHEHSERACFGDVEGEPQDEDCASCIVDVVVECLMQGGDEDECRELGRAECEDAHQGNDDECCYTQVFNECQQNTGEDVEVCDNYAHEVCDDDNGDSCREEIWNWCAEEEISDDECEQAIRQNCEEPNGDDCFEQVFIDCEQSGEDPVRVNLKIVSMKSSKSACVATKVESTKKSVLISLY